MVCKLYLLFKFFLNKIVRLPQAIGVSLLFVLDAVVREITFYILRQVQLL